MKDSKLVIFIAITVILIFLILAIPFTSLNQNLSNVIGFIFLLSIEFGPYIIIAYYFFFKSEYWTNRKTQKFAKNERTNIIPSNKTIIRNCQNCANSVILGDKYCQKCGTKVDLR